MSTRDVPPPPAKLVLYPDGTTAEWRCYWCEHPFIARWDDLPARLVLRCKPCGRFQVIGKSEAVRAAALGADEEMGAVALPPNIDPHKLSRIQQEYDLLKRRRARCSPYRIHQLTGFARDTIERYWAYIRK
jgi:hypothetical protein